MTTTISKQLAHFAARYGISEADARSLRNLVNVRARQQEHVCNGDPHPMIPNRADKSANAETWEKDSDRTAERLVILATRLGFDGVDFGVGLYPCLVKGTEACIMVP